ncbi:response regulator [Sphingobacterium sp. Mn56C]|uniref:response regulator n=1 Tax=Sphingobacterium sp. Mn56C TaxID=3395261 RepID=UPI003BE7894D
MNTRNKLKQQIIVSIGIAIFIIFSSATYLFYQLSNYMDRNDLILQNSQDQLNVVSTINSELYNYTQCQIKFIRTGNLSYKTQIQNITENLREKTLQLDQLSAENESNANDFIRHVKEILNQDHSNNLGDIKPPVERMEFWISEQGKNLNVSNDFVSSIVSFKAKEISKNEKRIQTLKYVTVSLIAISLAVIVYTIYKILQILNYLRQSGYELKRLNQEFQVAKENIEKTNWILENSASLSDRITGIDNTKTISSLILQHLNEILPMLSAAIYVREVDSETYVITAESGTNNAHTIQRFESGEGYLGKVAEEQKIKKQTIQDSQQLNIQTALINNLPATVFICPLVHETRTVGILEIALIADDNILERYHDYLQRVSKNVATRITFGQNHILVENLLGETQRQTEELEAQQEELRITNEELIHKTHLLESSEEELRVQQEELTQTNIELNQKAAELEKRNEELNQAQSIVEQKIAEVELASKYKSEFMANMSHELRTPLNSILILAKLLKDNKAHNLSSEQVKYAHVIHGAGSDLLELINEILDLAKIESGKIDLNLENIDTQDFLENTTDFFKAIAKDKEIDFIATIEENTPLHILTDEYRLQQIIKNFLSNAFKFTPKGGTVSFTIKKVNSNLHLEVIDSGKGISNEKQELIFEAFRQEDGSTSRKYGGTGLGLTISKEIASLLGGRIQLKSELGVGSTFTLIIPIQLTQDAARDNQHATVISHSSVTPKKLTETNMPEIQAPQTEKTEKENRKILIVEDDINFAAILKEFAEDYNFEVELAHDGEKAIQMAQTLLPDAIILDVMLPLADGWEVLRVLKENPETKHIPIHMMSAASFNKKEFIERGAIGFMHKPVTEKTIQKTFDNINLNLSQSVKKILLVEDQEFQSDFIKNSFADHNINVIQTFSLNSAWDKLNTEKNIDCIILDLHLPDGNGMDLIEKIKDTPALMEIPIIINTAHELPKDQYDKILSDARATVLKTDKSSDRLIDEVNLFLNKINDNNYQPLKNIDTLNKTNNLASKRVLIADDDMRNVFALTTTLQGLGMEIEIANNGKEAVDIIASHGDTIDIVLMDIMMPEMDGYEAIQRIRENIRYKNLPILAVTAKAMKGDREKSIQIGANDYISKPIDIDKLTSLMQVWLG